MKPFLRKSTSLTVIPSDQELTNCETNLSEDCHSGNRKSDKSNYSQHTAGESGVLFVFEKEEFSVDEISGVILSFQFKKTGAKEVLTASRRVLFGICVHAIFITFLKLTYKQIIFLRL